MLNSQRTAPLVDLWLNDPTYELEGRLGRIVNGSFQSGVTKTDFQTMRRRLQKHASLFPNEMKVVSDGIKVVDRYYVTPDGQQVRVREYVDTKLPPEVSTISAIRNLDVCTDGPYAVRFAIKSEKPCDDAKCHGAPTVTRNKELYSFHLQTKDRGLYKYELSEVTQAGSDAKEIHESEIEVQRGSTTNPMKHLPAAANGMIASVQANYKQAPMITRVL